LLVDCPFDAIELTSDTTDLLKQLPSIAECEQCEHGLAQVFHIQTASVYNYAKFSNTYVTAQERSS
jgi:hypothetical protein